MPLAFFDVEDGATRQHVDGVGQGAVFVVEVFHEVATDADAGLAGVAMAVDGHHSAWLDGVEHALGLVLVGVAQIQITTKPRAFLGLVA